MGSGMLEVRGNTWDGKVFLYGKQSRRVEVKIRAWRYLMDGKYAEYVHENQKMRTYQFYITW